MAFRGKLIVVNCNNVMKSSMYLNVIFSASDSNSILYVNVREYRFVGCIELYSIIWVAT